MIGNEWGAIEMAKLGQKKGDEKGWYDFVFRFWECDDNWYIQHNQQEQQWGALHS